MKQKIIKPIIPEEKEMLEGIPPTGPDPIVKNNSKENKPVEETEENPDTIIKRLADELNKTRQVAEQAINENQILRATVKALSQLI